MEAIIISLMWYLAGCANGIMDSIKFHDSYKQWGVFWSKQSWLYLYDKEKNWFEKIFNAAFDGWHLCKYIMNGLFATSLFIGMIICIDIFPAILTAILSVLLYIIGFKTTYK
jgi:hypothetical protein